MPARAWQAGAGPGDGPLTIDLDSTICETYGLAKEGARHHGYTGKRGYHPVPAIAAGTGDVLMSRLREGRANTARGAAHFLRETVGRVRYAGANGRLTLRADSGFYTHGVVSVCRKMDVRFSITIRQHKSLHNLIEAIPEDAWTPIPYWMDGAADVAETTCTPFQAEADAAPVRLIVRRVKPTPGSQLALFAKYSYHGFITDRDGELLEPEADHRRHAGIENAIRDLKYGVGLEPSPLGPLRRQRRLAGRPDDGPQPGPLDGADRSGRADSHHQDPPAAVLLPGRTAHPLGTPVDPASSGSLALARIHRRTGMDGVRTAEGGEGVTGAMIRARIWVDGRLAGGLQALLGAPMAAYSGCGERDGGIGHGKRRSRTGLARVCGDVGLAGGSVADGRRQAGSGMARSRARARLNCSSQGQRRGRCRVNRRAERVIRPAKAKTRRLRVLVVTIC